MDDTVEAPAWLDLRKRVYATGVLLVLIAGAVFVNWKIRSVAPRNDTMVVAGKTLPRLMVRDAAKNAVDLRDVKPGTRRVVAFYSPSCGVCQQELPELIPFPTGVELIMVNEGDAAEPDPFAASTGSAIRFSDPDASFKAAFKLPSLPTLLFVNEKGVVVDGLAGAHPPTVAQAKLRAFAQGHG